MASQLGKGTHEEEGKSLLTLTCKPESGERRGFVKHLAHPMSNLKMKLHWPDVVERS